MFLRCFMICLVYFCVFYLFVPVCFMCFVLVVFCVCRVVFLFFLVFVFMFYNMFVKLYVVIYVFSFLFIFLYVCVACVLVFFLMICFVWWYASFFELFHDFCLLFLLCVVLSESGCIPIRCCVVVEIHH